nr:RNA-directed DNA polymerase, eukaryota, reverse transcriptase zinc-binding domain protein [Tanacetum cinerariifolium]
MDKDFVDCVKHFEATGTIANGCNPSFIVLIPKKHDPIGFSDYRLVSLIMLLEFKMEKGLHQGDPLSPFLIIIVFEALQISILEACNKGAFKGCDHGSIPFMYLGLPVGKRMRFSDGWNVVVNRFRDRLSSWKSKSLSICERLTFI